MKHPLQNTSGSDDWSNKDVKNWNVNLTGEMFFLEKYAKLQQATASALGLCHCEATIWGADKQLSDKSWESD